MRTSLRRFTCIDCGGTTLLTGGTTGFRCDACKVAKGLPVGRSPQQQAHYEVATAIRKGVLAHPSNFPCDDCGGKAIEYDHRDYSKPLVVAPVCRRCNLRRGSALNKAPVQSLITPYSRMESTEDCICAANPITNRP